MHMFDARPFLRPIAHRGLHGGPAGMIENTAPAFEAAIARGYGIECDLRPARDGTPFVFHDADLDRLVAARGPLSARSPAELAGLTYKGQPTGLLTYAGLLALAGGKVPMLVEIKSEWDRPDARFLQAVAELSLACRGPLALMSFDPAVMVAMRELAPALPRGIVACDYRRQGEWHDRIGAERAERLTHLLESGPAAPDFFAYRVDDLPTPVTRFARDVAGFPLFAWTVRTEDQRRRAERWADAPIFEHCEPPAQQPRPRLDPARTAPKSGRAKGAPAGRTRRRPGAARGSLV
jgi:glycerophosphoryl diester phosphodiesterase